MENGKDNKRPGEIVVRTVNKIRVEKGETNKQLERNKSTSNSNLKEVSSSKDGKLTYAKLYAEACRQNIKGRSTMDKEELQKAVESDQ